MCGITGFYSENKEYDIQKMTQLLTHRGPDEQTFVRNGNCSFGVTRLSINDLENGSMPIYNETGELLVIQDGEIYNSPALRLKLERKGHVFKTLSDTEVIVHGYEEFGKNVVENLQGIFAFAIYDTRDKSIFLCRDRLGVKPLYYHQDNGDFFFGSEIKSIVSGKNGGFDIDMDSLLERFIFGHPVSYGSIISGILQLPPGHMAIYNPREGLSISRYFKPSFDRIEIDIPDALEIMKQTLIKVINKQLLSDVPVGVMLSGGIDSCGLLHIVNSLKNTRINTFTISDSSGHQEIYYSRLMSIHENSVHHELIVPEDQGVAHLPRYIWALEDIDYNHMMLYLLGQFIKGKVKCVLSGHGADELFLGYGMYKKVAEYGLNIQMNIQSIREITKSKTNSRFENIAGSFRGLNGLEEMIKFTQFYELPNDNLNLVDRLNMAHGVEVRVPYLDEDMVSLANSIPTKLLLNGDVNKLILREVFRSLGIPEEICSRPKEMAGRKTIPSVMKKIEDFADHKISDDYLDKHPFAQLLNFKDIMLSFEDSKERNSRKKLKSYVLCFDLLKRIFIDNNGQEPTNEMLGDF